MAQYLQKPSWYRHLYHVPMGTVVPVHVLTLESPRREKLGEGLAFKRLFFRPDGRAPSCRARPTLAEPERQQDRPLVQRTGPRTVKPRWQHPDAPSPSRHQGIRRRPLESWSWPYGRTNTRRPLLPYSPPLACLLSIPTSLAPLLTARADLVVPRRPCPLVAPFYPCMIRMQEGTAWTAGRRQDGRSNRMDDGKGTAVLVREGVVLCGRVLKTFSPRQRWWAQSSESTKGDS